MGELRIGIIEDEILTVENIALHLRRMGHQVQGTYTNFDALKEDLGRSQPDLFLIDIRLKGAQTGLDVAALLNSDYKIPFLFLTSHADSETVRKAMQTMPVAYITKPFSYEDLFIAIELVKAKISLSVSKSRRIEIKSGYEKEWIELEDILYLEADRSYVTIHMSNETKVLRQPLGNLLQAFQAGEMIRVHRSFAVNPLKVESVTGSKVIMEGTKIPLGPGYRKSFQEALRALRSHE